MEKKIQSRNHNADEIQHEYIPYHPIPAYDLGKHPYMYIQSISILTISQTRQNNFYHSLIMYIQSNFSLTYLQRCLLEH